MTATARPAPPWDGRAEAALAPPGPPRWRLTPGTRLLWRGDGAVQLERAGGGVVVSGLSHAALLGLTRRPGRPPGPSAAPRGGGRGAADALALHRLAALGYVEQVEHAQHAGHVDDGTPDRRAVPGAGDDPDGWAPPPGAPAPARAERRDARVLVHGLTRVSAYLGALLGASGVGHVSFASVGTVRRRDVLPGGLQPTDEGRRFGAAAAEAVRRAAPHVDVGPLDDREPDLVLICLDAPVEAELRDLLLRRGQAHLPVHVDAVGAEVGPLVLPGVTACLRCGDLHRLDRDPTWSLLAVQLLTGAAAGPPSDPDLAGRTATLAAAVALAYLDGRADAATATGSWELSADHPLPRRRSRRAHPGCPCGAAWSVPTSGPAPPTAPLSTAAPTPPAPPRARRAARQNGRVSDLAPAGDPR